VPERPRVYVLGGPNGAGKSTTAASILPSALTFLNADELAKSLPGYPSTQSDLEAGRRLLEMMESLERNRADFAVETTLASRSLGPRLTRMKTAGYMVRLVFLWAPNPEFSINRVAERVRAGGHGIPEATIRRRYHAGLRNLFQIYMPLSDSWEVHDNTTMARTTLVARRAGAILEVFDHAVWARIQEGAGHE
jgi:predicted ABC-type ATPase